MNVIIIGVHRECDNYWEGLFILRIFSGQFYL